MSNVRIGVAGAGVFGSFHAAKYSAHPDANLVGVFDVARRPADTLAARFSTQAFTDYEKFLGACDAVIVAAPASVHYELAAAALAAGKDVFVEKPLTTTTPAARELVAMARDAGLILQVGHQERYVCEAAGLFSRERPPHRIECIRHVPFTGRCGDVSAVMDLMIHDLDLIRRLTGARVLNTRADGDRDAVAAELFLTSGTIAALGARRAAKKSMRKMTIQYHDGVIEFDFIRRTVKNSTQAKLASVLGHDASPLAERDPLAHSANLFIESVATRRPLGVSGSDAAEVVLWARGIEAAAGLDSAMDISRDKRVRA